MTSVSDEAHEAGETVELIAIGDKSSQPRLQTSPKRVVIDPSKLRGLTNKGGSTMIRLMTEPSAILLLYCVLAMKQGKIKRFNASPSEVTFISPGYILQLEGC